VNADLNKPVYSIADGTVRKKSYLGSLGYLVAVEHTGSFVIPAKSDTVNGQSYSYPQETVSKVYSIYLHISNLPSNITEGSAVKKGQALGYIMNSGNGPHLHFEIRHPDTRHSSNWSMAGDSPNWAYSGISPTGYYLNLQKMVDAGFRDPRDFIEANQSDPDSDFILGDVNQDGRITSQDAADAFQLSLKGSWTTDELNRADYDGDGRISPQDAVDIFQASF